MFTNASLSFLCESVCCVCLGERLRGRSHADLECWVVECGPAPEPVLLKPCAAPPMAPWELLLLTFSLRCWLTSSASLAEEGPAGPLDWLLSDKGPFHHSQEYTEFVERNRQGFSTRYKIYRLVVLELRTV